MDLGKLNLPIAAAYNGDLADTITDLHNSFYLLQREIAITAGTAKLPASVAITKGQAVNVNSKQLRLADAGLGRVAVGIALQTVPIGAQCSFMLISGLMSGLTGLTANSQVYLGAAGGLVFVRPAVAIQSLGFALSTTELFLQVSSDLIP